MFFTKRGRTGLHTQLVSPFWSYKTLELRITESKSINSKLLKPVIYLWSLWVHYFLKFRQCVTSWGILIGLGNHLPDGSHMLWKSVFSFLTDYSFELKKSSYLQRYEVEGAGFLLHKQCHFHYILLVKPPWRSDSRQVPVSVGRHSKPLGLCFQTAQWMFRVKRFHAKCWEDRYSCHKDRYSWDCRREPSSMLVQSQTTSRTKPVILGTDSTCKEHNVPVHRKGQLGIDI